MARRHAYGAIATGISMVAAVGHASVMTFDDRDLFNAAAGAVTLETFESEATGTVLPSSVMAESGVQIAVGGSGWVPEITTQNAMSYNTTVGGDRHLRVAWGTGTYEVTFSHATRMSGFGFDLTGFQDFPALGGFEIDLWSEGSVTETLFIAAPGDFIARFYGVVSADGFDQITVRIQGSDAAGFDDLAIAFAAVPAPGALAVFLAGGMTGRRRRRRS